MAEIFPFRGYRYNQQKVELERVLTQPYDKITPEMQQRYATLSPYNLVTVEKGPPRPGDSENSLYSRAARALEDWIAEGVLQREDAPAVYVYSQEYAVPGGSGRAVRKGLIALGRIEDYSAGVVHRHEQTLSGPKADRLELLRHTRAHTGQLFMLYDDAEHQTDALLDEASGAPAPVELTDEYGVVHRVWPVTQPAAIQGFRGALADKKLVIADGHHRYETALAYRDECRARAGRTDPAAPHEQVMMTLFNARGPGLTILPTHRIVSGFPQFDPRQFRARLEPEFEWRTFPFTNAADRPARYAQFRRTLADLGGKRHAIGCYAGAGEFILALLKPSARLETLLPGLSLAQRQLDVVLLHRLVLERGLGITAHAVTAEKHLVYEREMDRAIAAVDDGWAQLCCLLNPVLIGAVMEMALAGEVLPQKSTDFYPKLLSGLTIYRLDG